MRALAMIPTYNEADNVEGIVEAVLSQDPTIEVLIVDDQSPDGTGDIADRLAKDKNGRVHVLHRTGVRGRGIAGVDGFKWTLAKGYDCVVEMDADFSHDPKMIPIFLQKIREFDVVIGSRFVDGGDPGDSSASHKILSAISNIFNRLVLGLKIKDVSGGYKCYRHQVLEEIDLNTISSWGYSIGAEILYKCHLKGFRMAEIPIKFADRRVGKSKANLKVIINYPLTVLKIRLKTGLKH